MLRKAVEVGVVEFGLAPRHSTISPSNSRSAPTTVRAAVQSQCRGEPERDVEQPVEILLRLG